MKRLIIVLALMLIPAVCLATIASEQITVSSTAIGITSTLLAPANSAIPTAGMCTVETNQMRFRVDGTDPTTTVGHVANAGDTITLTGHDELRKFRAIRVASDGALHCTIW
jgi:hypothetical protein